MYEILNHALLAGEDTSRVPGSETQVCPTARKENGGQFITGTREIRGQSLRSLNSGIQKSVKWAGRLRISWLKETLFPSVLTADG